MELEMKHINTATLQEKVTVHAPGTVANLVCGFDVLGMCLNAPYDIMEVKLLEEKKITIISKDGYQIPTDPALNTAGAPLIEMLNEIDANIG
ncbi:MAG: homoserine kinase, partial [Segetibacter sp.]|nr:homoserine kinase [Segetibacter sp.]